MRRSPWVGPSCPAPAAGAKATSATKVSANATDSLRIMAPPPRAQSLPRGRSEHNVLSGSAKRRDARTGEPRPPGVERFRGRTRPLVGCFVRRVPGVATHPLERGRACVHEHVEMLDEVPVLDRFTG